MFNVDQVDDNCEVLETVHVQSDSTGSCTQSVDSSQLELSIDSSVQSIEKFQNSQSSESVDSTQVQCAEPDVLVRKSNRVRVRPVCHKVMCSLLKVKLPLLMG